MLYRSTMRIATATILGLTALLGISAHAVVNLDATGSGVGTVVFAKETIAAEAGTTYYDVEAASDELEVRVQVGFQITGTGAEGTAVAIRYDLEGMRFATIPAAASDFAIYDTGMPAMPDLTLPAVEPDDVTSAYTVNAGFSDNDTLEIQVVVDEGDTLASGSTLRLDLSDKLELSATAPGTITVRINPGQVSFFEQPEPKSVTRTVARIADAISVTATPATPVEVEVTEDFEAFAPPRGTDQGEERLLGVLNVAVNENYLDAQSGLPLTFATEASLAAVGGLLNDAAGAGEAGKLTITFKNSVNDFAFADFKLVPAEAMGDESIGLGEGDVDCSNDGTELSFTTPPGATEPNYEMGFVVDPNVRKSGLCISIKMPEDADDPAFELPNAEFLIDAVFVKSERRQFTPSSVTNAPIGVLQRNGATVQIPFLSTSERHMQRLIIVNRGRQEVAYSMEFTSAAGVEVFELNDVTGVVPGNQEVILLVGDMIRIDGGRFQTAATLTLVAAPTIIDVLTSTLTENGASDTVNYDVK